MGTELTPWPISIAEKYQAEGIWAGVALGDILNNALATTPDKTALIDGDRAWTYQQLHERALQLAQGFLAQGFTAGDKVVVQLPNTGEFFEVIFALFKIGAVPVMALPGHRQLEITYFCQLSKAKAYIIPAQYDGFNYENLAAKVVLDSDVQNVFVVGDAQQFMPLFLLYLSEVDKALALPAVAASSLALLQLSGGTTNVPKLIPRSHDDYFYSVRQSNVVCELTESCIYLAALPVAHNFPLSSPGCLGVFYAGGTVVLAPNGSPDVAFALMKQHRITHTALVPPLIIAWLNAVKSHAHKDHADLTSLQVVQVGGAKLSEQIAQKIKPELGCALQQVFGMAEGLVNYTRLNDDEKTINTTQGKPMSPFDEVLVVDDYDNPVPLGESGHLLTRGPYTINGYFCAPEHNKTAFTADGFYRTGDIVRLTAAGYLQVEGRAKDQINRGGEKISAEEVENQLLAHPHILDAALVGISDDYLGERACAFIRLKDASEPLNLPKLKQFLRQRGLAEYKLPDRLELLDDFPHSYVGKVNKKELSLQLIKTLALETKKQG
ncbi:MAG: (2,3-dihydroxybenzoyl)adenylate synthase [Marinagarivorans sp.]|nr:(2,3-dihydroxybenzoyl)adenylate synthase [Marinagarivorans sp.]